MRIIPPRQSKVILFGMLCGGLWGGLPVHATEVLEKHNPLEKIYQRVLQDNIVPSVDVLEANSAVIGNIIYVNGDVFDLTNPKEDNAIFRLANHIHIQTRQHVVEKQLLIVPNEVFSKVQLEESERILRQQPYMFDALIAPIRYENNVVDLVVITRDSWSLNGSINISREGGKNEYSYSIAEQNFFGYGVGLQLARETNVDRTSTSFSYKNSNIYNGRNKLSIEYSDADDGYRQAFKFDRPFYSLNTKFAWGISMEKDRRTDSQYDAGEIINEFERASDDIELYYGWSRGLMNNRVRRWRLGATYSHNRFSVEDDASKTNELPEDRDFNYPWLEFTYLENNIIKAHRINQINRTEDINLGSGATLRLGWLNTAFDADFSGINLDLDANGILFYDKQKLLVLDVYTTGRFTSNESQSVLSGMQSKYYSTITRSHVFYTSLLMEYSINLDADQQILLGGDSGLRGYPLRYQSGDRKFLWTMEHRFYTDLHIWQLLHVGGVVFLDIGRAWDPAVDGQDNDGILKDVGLGLRVSSSRSGGGLVLHMNLAFPLDRDEDIDGMQFSSTIKNAF